MLFWGIAAVVVVASLAVVLAPLIRGAARPERRAAYDVQVYRDQLREIERDMARGVIGEAEADAVRVEVSRKLLAAADAEASEAATGGAPRRISVAAGAAAGFAALGLTLLLYIAVGAPGLSDQPRALRLAEAAAQHASRPGQAEAEAMIAASRPAPPQAPTADAELVEQLADVIEARPEDVEGGRLLARSLAALGRFEEAREAQERVVAALGAEAGARDHVDLAEFMILATGGYVSPEAEAALGRGLTLDPAELRGRYYSGLTLVQGGRPDLAYRLWERLVREGPPNAPWVQAAAADIGAVAEMAGLPPSAAPQSAPATPFEALPGEQQAAVDGMVASLGERLATEGGPPEDWAQLIRSLGVLGRISDAATIWTEAREVFAGDPAALAALEDAARTARLVQ